MYIFENFYYPQFLENHKIFNFRNNGKTENINLSIQYIQKCRKQELIFNSLFWFLIADYFFKCLTLLQKASNIRRTKCEVREPFQLANCAGFVVFCAKILEFVLCTDIYNVSLGPGATQHQDTTFEFWSQQICDLISAKF